MQVLGAVVERRGRAGSPRMSRRCSGVRSPRTYGSQTGRSRGSTAATAAGIRVADPAADAVDEQPAGVARPADHRHAGGGVRDRPEPGDLDPLLDHAPRDERGAADDQHVAGGVGARRRSARPSRRSSRRPRARRPPARSSRTVPDRLDAAHDVGQRRRRGAGLRRQRLVPPDEVEQRVGGHRRGRVDGAPAGEGVVGHRLGGPVPGRLRRVGGVPGEEREQLAAVAGLGGIGVVALAAVVAVEQARADAAAVGVDRAERRHHRRDVHGGDVEPLAHLRQRGDARRPATPRRRRARTRRPPGCAPGAAPGPGRRRCRPRRPPPPSPTSCRCRCRGSPAPPTPFLTRVSA